jgi:hypothetical protein
LAIGGGRTLPVFFIYCHMSTSAVDTWRAVNNWTENVIEVPNEFLLLTGVRVPPMKQIKTQILNLKKSKTQVPIGYLTLQKLLNSF